MSHETVKTVKVHPWGKGQGAFVEINEKDFDAQKHKLYGSVAPPPPAPVAVVDGELTHATVKAVELAAESGIDLASVVGTGKNGKITAEDVEAAIEKLTAPESDDK